MSQNELLPPEEAARYLGGLKIATLQWWRTMGRGPAYVKLGRKVYYKRAALDAFISKGERDPEAA